MDTDRNDLILNSPTHSYVGKVQEGTSPLSPFKKGRNEYSIGAEINFTTKS